MTEAQKKKKILSYILYWVEALGLQNWELNIVWRYGNGCEIQVNTPYKLAKVFFDLTLEEREWNAYALHELLHILTAEYRQWLHLVEERVTKQEFKLFHDVEEGVVNSLMVMILCGRLKPNTKTIKRRC